MALKIVGNGPQQVSLKQKSRLFADDWVDCVIYSVVKYGSLWPFRAHEFKNTCGTQQKGRKTPPWYQLGGVGLSSECQPHIPWSPRKLEVLCDPRFSRKDCQWSQNGPKQADRSAVEDHVRLFSNWLVVLSILDHVRSCFAFPARHKVSCIPFIKPPDG